MKQIWRNSYETHPGKLADVMFDGIPKTFDKSGYMDIETIALVRKPKLSFQFLGPH